LKKLSGGVDGLIIRVSLFFWKYGMGEARHDVLDGGILNIDGERNRVPICVAAE
jgi:hypothetical protein